MHCSIAIPVDSIRIRRALPKRGMRYLLDGGDAGQRSSTNPCQKSSRCSVTSWSFFLPLKNAGLSPMFLHRKYGGGSFMSSSPIPCTLPALILLSTSASGAGDPLFVLGPARYRYSDTPPAAASRHCVQSVSRSVRGEYIRVTLILDRPPRR